MEAKPNQKYQKKINNVSLQIKIHGGFFFPLLAARQVGSWIFKITDLFIYFQQL